MKRLNSTMLMAKGNSAAPGKIAPFWASVRLNVRPHSVMTMARTMNAEEVAKIEKKHARNRRFMYSPWVPGARESNVAVDAAAMGLTPQLSG